MRTSYLLNIFTKLYQHKIFAYSGLLFVTAYTMIGIASARPITSVQNLAKPAGQISGVEAVALPKYSQPASAIPTIQTSDEAVNVIADQAALRQKEIAQEQLTIQRIAEENRLAEEKRIAEEKRLAEDRAAAELQRRLKGEPGENYPYTGASYYSNSPDPWGMYKRQCVSFAAWKVASSGRVMPYWGGRGNANLWDDNARSSGIPVDSNPTVGSVAVDNSGYYGHVMFVEEVYGDGTILVSQYNADGAGHYSIERRASSGLRYIHF